MSAQRIAALLETIDLLTSRLDAATRRADEVGAILNEPIVWERDLEDDCIASWRGLFAHAEQMDRQVADDPESCDSWFCSVTRPDPACKSHNGSGNPCTCTDIIHSAENCAHPRSGFEAREMCERYMRVEAARAALSLPASPPATREAVAWGVKWPDREGLVAGMVYTNREEAERHKTAWFDGAIVVPLAPVEPDAPTSCAGPTRHDEGGVK